VFTLDGVEIRRITERVPQDADALGAANGDDADVEAAAEDAAGNVQIDWVAAWQYDPTAVAPPPPTTAPAPPPTSSPPTRPTFVRYRVIRS
jgi:hypothetical protein